MNHQPALQPHVACLGNPVVGNPTQFVMSRATRECGLDWRFFTSQVREDEFEIAVRGIQALGLHGMVLLDPFQSLVVPLLDTVTESARHLNRVTVARSDGNSWLGDNLLPTALWQAIMTKHPSSPTNQHTNPPGHVTSESTSAADSSSKTNNDRGTDQTSGEPTEQVASPKNYLLYCGSEAMGQAMVAAWPNTDWELKFWPMNSPLQDETVTETMDQLRNLQYSALVIESDLNASSLKNIPNLNWVTTPSLLRLDTTSDRSNRKVDEVFLARGFSGVEQVEWLSYEAAANFTFWTGVIPPIDLIRESLEEYLQW